MKKYIYKAVMFLLMCVMLFSLSLPAMASEYIEPPPNSRALFDMYSPGFGDMLRSDITGKRFATYDYQGSTMWVRGRMTHDSVSRYAVEVSFCHKIAPYGMFDYVSPKTLQYERVDYSQLANWLPTDSSYPNSQTYYVCFKNKVGYGSVEGYVKLFASP